MLVLYLAVIVLAPVFFIWLLTRCLRMGAVGGGKGPWRRDAHRETQPIRYWTGIAGLAIGAVFSTVGALYVVWLLLS